MKKVQWIKSLPLWDAVKMLTLSTVDPLLMIMLFSCGFVPQIQIPFFSNVKNNVLLFLCYFQRPKVSVSALKAIGIVYPLKIYILLFQLHSFGVQNKTVLIGYCRTLFQGWFLCCCITAVLGFWSWSLAKLQCIDFFQCCTFENSVSDNMSVLLS